MLGDDTVRRRLSVALRSYSRRLILILTVLIVVPLLLLDAVLVRALDQRLETEHRAAAEVALEVAQRVLSDYLLALEPGFGIRAVLEQEVLDWLAQVVDREVNVYWGSQSFASSRPELFTAGLLPDAHPWRRVLRARAEGGRAGGANAHRRRAHLPRALRAARGGAARRAARSPLLPVDAAPGAGGSGEPRARAPGTPRGGGDGGAAAAGARGRRAAGRRIHPAGDGDRRGHRSHRARRHLARPAPERAGAADAGGGDRRDGAARGAEPQPTCCARSR